MPVSDTAVAARRASAPLVRDAVPADYPAIREVLIAAYRQYADLISLDIFSPYLADVLDLDKHARHGRLLVVEVDGWICGFGAFYPDTTVQDVGFPAGWAGGRVFAFHTASFMTGAIALYDRLGYRRAPEFDFDMAARYSRFGAAPVMSITYLRCLDPARARVPASRCA